LDDPPWELRLELVTHSKERWGYVSLIPVHEEKKIALDMNVLTGEFRVALSKAIERACNRTEAGLESESDDRISQFRKIAAGS
jgi:PHP family Zn ribbon phosphoesterase